MRTSRPLARSRGLDGSPSLDRSRSLGVSLTLPLALLIGALAVTACARAPYVPGQRESDLAFPLRDGEPQWERGRPDPVLDGLGHYVFSLPSKLLLLSWRVENHGVSERTEDLLSRYLRVNGLCNVKVRINQYAVAREWSRLFRNRTIHPFWRYTLGVLTVANYTILPQRVFGGDNYNPYTHTIHLYSDLPAVALHEAGHAKDFVSRRRKGVYAALRILPLVPLYQEGIASADALGFRRARGDAGGERADTPLLWSAWGSYLAGEGTRFYTGSGWIDLATFPIAWLGHAAGRVRAAFAVPEADPGTAETFRALEGGGPGDCLDAAPGGAEPRLEGQGDAELLPGPAAGDTGSTPAPVDPEPGPAPTGGDLRKGAPVDPEPATAPPAP